MRYRRPRQDRGKEDHVNDAMNLALSRIYHGLRKVCKMSSTFLEESVFWRDVENWCKGEDFLVTYGKKIIALVADGRPPLSFTRFEVVKTQAVGCNRIKYSWFN